MYMIVTKKNEIDVIAEKGPASFAAIEIKSSSTFRTKYFDMLERIIPSELGLDEDHRYVGYAGEDGLSTPRGRLVPYTDAPSVLGLEWWGDRRPFASVNCGNYNVCGSLRPHGSRYRCGIAYMERTRSRQLLRDRRARALPCAVANRRGIGLSAGLRA